MAGRPRKNFGERPSGWGRIGLEVPDELVQSWTDRRLAMPGSSQKLMGTAAVALFLSLPKEAQESLYRWAHEHELDPDKLVSSDPLPRVIPVLLMLGTISPPPTESRGKGAKAGPPSGAQKQVLGPNEWQVRYPAKQRDGYTEEVIVTYHKADPGDAAGREAPVEGQASEQR